MIKNIKSFPEEIVMIQILEGFNWTYDEYMNTPNWVIDLILKKSEIDFKLKDHGNK